MSKQRADISQIQKYLNGELDAKAMHQLEREAQDDPFLMDALDGYTSAATDQTDNLASLTERLRARTDNKVKRMIPWTAISIAAGVVGFFIVIGLLYRGNTDAPKQLRAQVQQPAQKDSATGVNAAPVFIDKQKDVAALTPAQAPVSSNRKFNAGSQPGSAPVVANEPSRYTAPVEAVADVKPHTEALPADKNGIAGYYAAKPIDTSNNMPQVVAITRRPASVPLTGRVKGVTTTERPSKRQDNAAAAYALNLPPTVTGLVLSQANGAPLPGVTVRVEGKDAMTQTDAKGKFALPATKEAETLSFNYMGYNGQKVNARADDSVNVKLNENIATLNEVVVTNDNSKSKKAAIVKAHPVTGWSTFKDYLKTNSIAATAGIVQVQFTVTPIGDLSNIIITKSLNSAADGRAIALIKNGPKWLGNSGKTPEVVTVDVKFEKAK